MALTVLIVEDERNLAKSIATFLTRKGHSVTTAEDGEHGWRGDCSFLRLTDLRWHDRA
jgi:DNA-binding response OmpR family regulator